MVIAMNDIEKGIIDLLRQYKGVSIFTLKQYSITPDSDLNKDLRLAPEDAYDLFAEYFEKFSVDCSRFNFLNYFPNDGGLLFPCCFIPKSVRPTGKQAESITVKMLIESAKAGRWLYD